jgi:hypothetical protein
MRRTLLTSLLAGCAASLALASPALAGQSVNGSGQCHSPKLERPFAQFGDAQSYSLLPDGGLEQNGTSWSLSGARVVSGNEPFAVHGKNDKRSLELPAGSSAATDTFCVAERHTHARLFVTRTGGSELDTLGVSAVVTSADGSVAEHALGALPGGDWAPTDVVSLASELPELESSRAVDVQLRFAPSGDSTWRIDDLYVDPPVRCC